MFIFAAVTISILLCGRAGAGALWAAWADGGGKTLSGILVIDKPVGWTAHDVVARVRRLTGLRRVGHAGTLDPAATGVLPVCVGEATKVVEYLSGHGKTYLAAVLLGTTTDTDDL